MIADESVQHFRPLSIARDGRGFFCGPEPVRFNRHPVQAPVCSSLDPGRGGSRPRTLRQMAGLLDGLQGEVCPAPATVRTARYWRVAD